MKKVFQFGLLSLLALALAASCEKEDEKNKGNEPGTELPGGQEPGGEEPGGEEPGGEEPGGEEPGGEVPEGETFTETAFGISLEMVLVEGGEFRMGATEEQGDEVNADESPVRMVKMGSYYIGKYEVTQAQWTAVMGTTLTEQREKTGFLENHGEGADYPMYYVSWNEAKTFCEKLSAETGRKYVLPSEAQWEYAARGGNRSKGYKYSGSNNVEEVAWTQLDGIGEGTRTVGSKKANELGIFDMSGNVDEWCMDWYGPYDVAATDNPVGPYSGDTKINRGGSWNFMANGARVAYRDFRDVTSRFPEKGFRVALIL